MKRILNYLAIGTLTIWLPAGFAGGADELGSKCPITGKTANPNCSLEYEAKTYTFCSGECRTKFNDARLNSLYHKIGGKAAIAAAVDLFYKRVLADKRVNPFFENVSMASQHRKQKAFLAAALGGPEPWTGKDLRRAHADLELNESHFNAIAGHLRATLEELKVKPDLIDQIMAVVASTKDEVLNRKKESR